MALHQVVVEQAFGERVGCRVRASPAASHSLPLRDQMQVLARPRADDVEQLLGAPDAPVGIRFLAEMRDHSLQQPVRDHYVELRTLDAVNGVDGDAAAVLEDLSEEVDSTDVRGTLAVQTFDPRGRTVEECLMVLGEQCVRLPVDPKPVHQGGEEFS